MTKVDFLKKYPEMDDDGDVSKVKITLLTDYSSHFLSKNDSKVKDMLEDYNKLILTEGRDQKIELILLEQSLKKLKTTLKVR